MNQGTDRGPVSYFRGGVGFAAYDAVGISLVDDYGDVISSGTVYTDDDGALGAFSTRRMQPWVTGITY